MEGDTDQVQDETMLSRFAKWYTESGLRKVGPVSDYLIEKLEHDEKEKIIVFAHHLDVIAGLEQKFNEKNINYIKEWRPVSYKCSIVALMTPYKDYRRDQIS